MISKLANVNAKQLTADGKISGPGVEIYGMTLSAAGANATVSVHHSVDNSGDVVWKLSAAQNTSQSIVFPHPISLSSGAYADLGGSGAVLSVAYKG